MLIMVLLYLFEYVAFICRVFLYVHSRIDNFRLYKILLLYFTRAAPKSVRIAWKDARVECYSY